MNSRMVSVVVHYLDILVYTNSPPPPKDDKAEGLAWDLVHNGLASEVCSIYPPMLLHIICAYQVIMLSFLSYRAMLTWSGNRSKRNYYRFESHKQFYEKNF